MNVPAEMRAAVAEDLEILLTSPDERREAEFRSFAGWLGTRVADRVVPRHASEQIVRDLGDLLGYDAAPALAAFRRRLAQGLAAAGESLGLVMARTVAESRPRRRVRR